MATTKTTDLFIPEVVDAEIKEGVKNNSIFMTDAEVDYDLVGKPGESVTFVSDNSIGEAEELTEDTALTPAKLTQNEMQATIIEFGKAVEVSYRAETQGMGSAVDRGTKQIKTVISNGLDTKLYNTYLAEATNVLDVSTESETKLSYSNIVRAVSLMELDEEGAEVRLYIHPDQVVDVITDQHFIDVAKYSQGAVNPRLASAEVGKIHDVRIFKTKKIHKSAEGVYSNILVSKGAAKVKFQKEAEIESDKDILARKIVVAATTLVALKTVNQNRLVVLKTK
ncbi:N4-gp56 family major capsid protein [Brevibacillus brevis]|uniref:N4-gp56 family major capsid protein n=1 Tax=Brevibacillus brevis TaxID=1393 RepID=UPI000D10EFCD|nr:N4-gp56 family major capsid protein [Brevibacillus brevis]PSJ67452.1 N4-gp56 family major capsid protein [Brevibacillus brevis]RED28439.1 N4-gp56 family major capsid protein [Brevibacillus brevis]GEC90693.1 hypothetical protein BBR01nite_30240 [Brevibacillus brevis]VEF91134.1 Uncharacterised protein [Brevibacillus brevis]